MKKAVYLALAMMVLVLAQAAPSEAHVRGGVWIGPVWGPGWWGPYPYAYPYGYAAPPVVIREEPPVYISQPPAQPQAQPQQYWYYCPDPQGYYPNVKACPKGWLKVVPSPNPPPAPPAEPKESK